MKTVAKPEIKFQTFTVRNQVFHLRKISNGSRIVNSSKFYQKFFVFFMTLSTFLIFPESPKQLETICNSYYSKQICNVW